MLPTFSTVPAEFDGDIHCSCLSAGAKNLQTPETDQRFELLKDILDQSYGFGFIRRLVPPLGDKSFSDPLKAAFQVIDCAWNIVPKLWSQ